MNLNQQDKTDKALRRYVMIEPLVDYHLPWGEKSSLLAELSQKHGVSVSTLKRYCRRYQEQRLAGLMPKENRADKGRPRRIPQGVLYLAGALREEVPGRSTQVIIKTLEEAHPVLKGKLKRSTLDRHLRRMGKARKQIRQRGKPRRQFAKERRGALWQIDLCLPALYGRDEQGEVRQAVLVAILDDATRYIPHAEFHFTQDGGVVESCFKKAVTKFGRPVNLFFDNGAQFFSEQFTGALSRVGVRHLRARPGEPEGKGKLERWFRTLQESLVPEIQALGETPSLPELNRYLMAWIEEHYHKTVHSELGATPKERWENDPTPLNQVDPVKLEAAFLLSTTRRVSKTSLVHLLNRRYLVSDSLIGAQGSVSPSPARKRPNLAGRRLRRDCPGVCDPGGCAQGWGKSRRKQGPKNRTQLCRAARGELPADAPGKVETKRVCPAAR